MTAPHRLTRLGRRVRRRLRSTAHPYLHFDNPRLRELEADYAQYRELFRSLWSDDFVRTDVRLPHFRDDSAYVWERGYDRRSYRRTHEIVRDAYGDVLACLKEDGAFGAQCIRVDGELVSRDVMDSAAEIRFLQDALGGLSGVSLLDIGAGYGRFAHRVHEYDASTRLICTDGVALSTFISEFYVDYRQCGPDVAVVPLTDIATRLADARCDVAVNIHSFPECPLAAIEWWLELVVEHGVEKLFLVPNDVGDLRSWEPDGERKDFGPLLKRFGFRLELSRPNYPTDAAGLLFPAEHLLFAR